MTDTIQKQLDVLQEAHTNRSKFEEDMLELTKILCVAQESLKQLTRGVGHQLSDAQEMMAKLQEIQDQIVDSQPLLTNLQQTMEQLKAQGLASPTDEMNRLNRQYEDITEHTAQQREKLKGAVTLREQYYTTRAELETCLRQCQEQTDAVDVLGVSVPTKLDRYKNITETLQAKESSLAGIEDKGQQISIEGNVNDVKAIQEQLRIIKEKFNSLRDGAAKSGSDLNRVIAERQDFDGDVTKTLQLLKDKEQEIKSHDLLSMDVGSVESELNKISTVRREVENQLQDILERIEEQKARYNELDEAVPLELKDKMDEIEELKDPLMNRLREEEEKLSQAKEDRELFSVTYKHVIEWLKDADDRIKPNYDGLDYDAVEEQLEQHTLQFASEPEMHKKMDLLLDLQEKLTPTLDMNDKTTLKETINNLNQRLTTLSAAAEKQEKVLKEGVTSWKDYQEKLTSVTELLEEVEGQWQVIPQDCPPKIEQARGQLHDTQEFISKLASHQDLLTELNTKATGIESQSCQPTKVSVERMLAEINEKWTALNTQAEDKVTATQETVDNWEIYQEKVDSLGKVLHTAADLMPGEELEASPTKDLNEHLEKINVSIIMVLILLVG